MAWEWDRHHIYGPRNAYTTRLEREFRNLFTLKIPRTVHTQLNQLGALQFPIKPSEDFMREAIRQVRQEAQK